MISIGGITGLRKQLLQFSGALQSEWVLRRAGQSQTIAPGYHPSFAKKEEREEEQQSSRLSNCFKRFIEGFLAMLLVDVET